MVKKVKIDEIKENPNNPKTIDWFKLEQLKKSLEEFPDMLEIRPIVIDTDGIIIGGNMRWKAAKELGWEEVWVVEILDKKEEFLIKDNLSYGEWNWEGLSDGYESKELLDWGLDVPLFFRGEDIDLGVQEDTEDEKEKEKIPKKELPMSTKKAFYYFYTIAEKEEIMDILKKRRGEMTNEEWILEKIRQELDGSI